MKGKRKTISVGPIASGSRHARYIKQCGWDRERPCRQSTVQPSCSNLPNENDSLIAFWIDLPIAIRLLILALLGIVIGAVSNDLIYRVAYFPRPIGPWKKPPENAPARKLSDRVPIIGWVGLSRESSIHGRGYWIRPLLIEIGCAVAFPLLYWLETQTGLLLPQAFQVPIEIAKYEPWLTVAFAVHLVMVSIMVVATFIDFDEQTIPDILTLPGTIFALVMASITPNVFLPVQVANLNPIPIVFCLPNPLAAKWTGGFGFCVGITMWTGWCLALLLFDRRLIMRRGFAKAIEFYIASIRRDCNWQLLLGIWFAGLIGIRIVFGIGGPNWIGLLTSLIGMAAGGGVVWAVRVVGSVVLRKEAMGFGDVSLMAMVGAFIGWHGAVMAFFLAPIAAIGIVLVVFIITRDSALPFGPYLCAGTILVIVGWDRLINGWMIPNLAMFMPLGGFVVLLVLSILGIMAVLLMMIRFIKERVLGIE